MDNHLTEPASDPLSEKVKFLARPENHPDPTIAVTTIETHMSWVFVADDFVYKLKKPVRLEYLDFSTLAARKLFCEESLRLNRRLAPDVYLGVVALTRDAANRLHVGGAGQPVEWLEKMRRLPEALMLDHAIAAGAVSEQDVIRFTRVLTDFYQRAQPVELSEQGYRERFARNVRTNHQQLTSNHYGLDQALLDRVCALQLGLIESRPALFDARVRAGRIIEAHGDLRPEHVCLQQPPVFIDCLEFNRDFRLLDTVDEMAYLALECEHAGADFIGPILFDTYEKITGDRAPGELKSFYKSYRATVRAKLAAWHVKDHPEAEHAKWLGRAAAYLELADGYARQL